MRNNNNLNQSNGIKLNIKGIKAKKGEINLYITKKGELEHTLTEKGLDREDLKITKERDFMKMYQFFLMEKYGTINN